MICGTACYKYHNLPCAESAALFATTWLVAVYVTGSLSATYLLSSHSLGFLYIVLYIAASENPNPPTAVSKNRPTRWGTNLPTGLWVVGSVKDAACTLMIFVLIFEMLLVMIFKKTTFSGLLLQRYS
jgi:hypothetical protein